MDDAAFAAIHRIEVKWPARLLHIFGGGQGAEAQFLNTQRPVIVSIESHSRVVLRRYAQCLHRQQFQSKQQLRPVFKKQVDIGSGELDDDVRVLDVRLRVLANPNIEGQVETGDTQNRPKKILDPRLDARDSILFFQLCLPQAYLLKVFFNAGFGAAITGAGVYLLINICCRIPTKLPVSQYNTKPLDIL